MVETIAMWETIFIPTVKMVGYGKMSENHFFWNKLQTGNIINFSANYRRGYCK
jgi:hypothetical protein